MSKNMCIRLARAFHSWVRQDYPVRFYETAGRVWPNNTSEFASIGDYVVRSYHNDGRWKFQALIFFFNTRKLGK